MNGVYEWTGLQLSAAVREHRTDIVGERTFLFSPQLQHMKEGGEEDDDADGGGGDDD